MDPLSAGRRIAALIGKSGDAPRVIRAYHGSPHSFSRFDASRIGTGEGAQAYGHGLYFAGNEGVARTYRDITPSLLPPEAEELNQQIKQLIQQQSDLFGELQTAADADGTFVVGWGDIKDPPPAVLARVAPQLAAIRQQLADAQGRMQNVLHNRRGHMYEVEIGYPEQALLDWDRPVGADVAGRLGSPMADDLAEEAKRMAGMGQLPRHMQVLKRIASGEPGLATGEMVYRAAGRFDPPASRPGWGSVTNTINDSVTNQARAAERLLDAGIPGIRYLDQGSRSAGEGTRNYVMFPGTEDRIRILRQYGLLPPLVGAGMMQEE